MKAILLLALANLRRRRLPAVLMGVVLAASAALLATALGIVTGLARPVAAAYERLDGPHLVLDFDTRVHDPAAFAAWWEQRDGVRAVATYALHRPQGKVLFRGKEIGRLTVLVERLDTGTALDRLEAVAGRAEGAPGSGEVWVPTSIAYRQSPPLAVGETIRVPAGDGSLDLRVAAIVVDPLSSSTSLEPVRLWVAPGALAEALPLTELAEVWFEVRLADPAMLDGLWARFQESLAAPYSGLRIPYDAVMDTYLFVHRLVGLLLLLFSAISAAIILLILSFTVSAAILSDYRTIGILKAQGFTSRNVAVAYLVQHLLVALVGLPVGAGLGVALLRLFLASLTRTLGLVDAGLPLGLPVALAVGLLAGLVALAAYLAARRVGRIRPAEALRFGAPRRETARGRLTAATGFGRLPVGASLGLRALVTDRGRSTLLFLSLLLTVFVFVFAVNTSATFSDLGGFGPLLGLDASDVTIQRSTGRFSVSHEEFTAELAADDRVAVVVPGRPMSLTAAIPAVDGLPARSIIASAYGGDMDAIGVENLRGRNPATPNEVSLAVGTARDYHRDVGDWFDVSIEGSRFRLLVTGVYQSTSNFGQGFRVQLAVVTSANPAFSPTHYMVVLEPGTSPAAWAEEYGQRYGAAVVAKATADIIRESAVGITGTMNLLVLLLAAVFAAVAAIIVFNSTVIRVTEQRREMGVLKSVGMTAAGLVGAQLVTILCLAALAAAVGLPAALVLSPHILSALGVSLGLIRFPARVSVPGTVAAVFACAAIAVAGGLAAGRRILRISPRVLIQE